MVDLLESRESVTVKDRKEVLQPKPKPELKQDPKLHPSRRGILKAATLGIALGTFSSVITADNNIYERTRTDPRNVFETGSHASDDNEINDVLKRFNNGDPDANMWNTDPALEKRLASLHPRVLTVDGACVTALGNTLDKNNLWLILPCRPSKMNQSDYYAISGDIAYADMGKDWTYAETKSYTDMLRQKLSLTEDADQTINATTIDRDQSKQIKLAIATGVISALAFVGAGHEAFKASPEKQPNEKSKNVLSRRSFMKNVAVGAAAVFAADALKGAGLFLQSADSTYASNATTEKGKEFWQRLSASIDDVPPNVWLDGRTALLIAKNEDAMDFLRKNQHLSDNEKSAVVMGKFHEHRADRFMHDKAARNAAILALAQHMISIAYTVIEVSANLSNAQYTKVKKQLMDQFVNYFSTIEINHITDQDPNTPHKELPNYIDVNVTPVTSITSKQVENVLQSLYQG